MRKERGKRNKERGGIKELKENKEDSRKKRRGKKSEKKIELKKTDAKRKN